MISALFLIFPATAFFWLPFFIEEFEQGKVFCLIGFACFAFFWVDWRKIFSDKIAMGLALFSISGLVSTYLSVDQQLSLFGNIKCRNGALVSVSYLILYLSLIDSFKDRKVIRQAIDIILICSLFVGLYAIGQFLGFDFRQWKDTLIEDGYFRPMSSMGHPNFMANYMAMVLPFAIWSLSRRGEPLKKVGLVLLIIVSIFSIWISLSRGMWIAALAGLFIYAKISKVQFKKTWSIVLIASVLAGSTFIFVPKMRGPAIKRIKTIGSLGGARKEYPLAAYRIWKHYPWFGIGTDAYEIGFDLDRTTHYWEIERGGSPHRAHNDFLNLLATQGLFGALAGIFIAVTLLCRILISRSNFKTPAVASIVVFYVAGFSSFYVVSTGVLFIFNIFLLKDNEQNI